MEEIAYRTLLDYPPAGHMMAILGSCPDEQLLETGIDYLKKYVERISGNKQIQMIGPASPKVAKVRDVYRRVIYLKSSKASTLIRVKDMLEQYIEINPGYQNINIQFDFNT